MGYAVNGALHYGNAILDEGTYKEVVIVGINGTEVDNNGIISDAEIKAYYVSQKNNCIPKLINGFDFVMIAQNNIDNFYALLDTLNLTNAELEDLKRSKEAISLQEFKESFVWF